MIDFLVEPGPPCDVAPCSAAAVIRAYREASLYSIYACLDDELFVTDMFAAGHF